MIEIIGALKGQGDTELQKAWVQFLKEQHHNIAIYLTFNDYIKPEAATEILRRYMAKVNSLIVGRNWDKRSNKRIKGFFAIEHMHSNLHFGGSVCVTGKDVWEASRTMSAAWTEMVPKGSSNIGPIRDETACHLYNTKELRSTSARDNWIDTEVFWIK